MAVTEGHQLGLVVLMYDPAIVKTERFTDVVTRKVSKIDFIRISGNVLLCSVDDTVGTIDWKNNAFPVPTKITPTKGLTVMELS